MAEPRNCPKCGTQMNFRLGEYECPQCGHYEAQIKEAQQRDETSGPGFKQPWQPGGTRPGAVVPPPPASGTIFQPGQQIRTGPGGSTVIGGAPQFELYPSLNMEMGIYFGLHVAVTVAIIIVAFAFGGMFAGLSSSFNMSAIHALLGFLVLVFLVRLSVIWFVLYGSVIWVKWCCGGCTLIGILGAIPSILAVGTTAHDSPLVGLADVALSIWFLTIVYRDIQRRQTL